MSTRASLAAAFSGLLVLVALSGSPAQPPKSKSKTPDADKSAAATAVIEMYEDRGGEYRFRIKHGDTLLAISGKGYETKDDCRKVIETLQKEVAKAKITEAARSADTSKSK
jgi:uncharacterized protein YegP (UPF0339 family)